MGDLLRKGDFVVGVDIGGTKIMATVYNHKFETVGQCRKRSKSRRSDQAAEERIIGIIQEAIEDAGSPKIRGIGAGTPGPSDPVRGIVIDTPNLGWKNLPLGDILRDRFGVPAAIDNDVNVGTYGEWCFGDVSDCEDILGVFPGTGIGAGIIINKKLLHGFSGAAGEIGHMTIEVDGPYCGCGKRGCLEAVASRIAIAKEVAALAVRGDAPYILRESGPDIDQIKSGLIAKAIAEGEKMVEGVVRRAAYYVGIAVGSAINLISPQAVVLGGGLVEAMRDLYIEEVTRGVKEHAMPFLRKGVRIVPAKLGDSAVVLGGARMISERLAKE